MPLQATSGAASYDAFGGGVPVEPVYIEQIFQTYLYTGNGSTQTITNNIDLSTKGGLTWIKARTDTSGGATSHVLVDTVRGSSKWLSSDATSVEATNANLVTGFTTSGFSVGNTAYFANENAIPYASWTFREQAKFFDIVTYTGDGNAGRTVAHNLNSEVGAIWVKCTSTAHNWQCYHRSVPNTSFMVLNSTAAAVVDSVWNNTTPTSSVFTLGSGATVNQSGETYVAYLFAHNAGGFGLTGTDNVISCGSYVGDGGTNNQITLGYEPQWILVKKRNSTSNWWMFDTMRGWSALTTADAQRVLRANSSFREVDFFNAVAGAPFGNPTSTGFDLTSSYTGTNESGSTYIYIAIRRGPMAVPTSGTSVFALGGTASSTLTTSFAVDAFIQNSLTSSAANSRFCSRLQGSDLRLVTSSTDAEAADNGDSQFGGKSYAIVGAGGGIVFGFGRAPSFFDEVCYTGNSVTPRTITHNLGVAPELMLIKSRSNARGWAVYASAIGNNKYLILNGTNAALTDTTMWVNTAPTSSVFTVGDPFDVNNTAYTYVAYLFATCAGVSKVGSYTGTGTTLQVDCGFTGGARFVLIKRTDSTGDWYVWNSALGIIAGNDPYILLNSTAAQVTGTDYIDTYSAGFEISSTAPAAINASAGSFIFLAIA